MTKGFSVYFTLFLAFAASILLLFSCDPGSSKTAAIEEDPADTLEIYTAPDTTTIPANAFGELVRYGRKLVLNTAYYIGPEGVAGKYLGNKMNCTNCHLDGGTRPFGLNYFSTHGRYPQFRSRENKILSLAERVNNCIERPHNGTAMPLDSKEMLAITSYIKWLGEGIPSGTRVDGDQPMAVSLPDFVLDVQHGKQVYVNECARCHGVNGEGKLLATNVTYEYPPLWGPSSYQAGSSMFRVIKAAQFIKANMPHDKASWQKPYLTDRDALDVAAYMNDTDKVRPAKKGLDYPDKTAKPVDYPFGPYDDVFTEQQHKYGPFQPIIDYRKKHGLFVNYQ